jgi:hypothetical protein
MCLLKLLKLRHILLLCIFGFQPLINVLLPRLSLCFALQIEHARFLGRVDVLALCDLGVSIELSEAEQLAIALKGKLYYIGY